MEAARGGHASRTLPENGPDRSYGGEEFLICFPDTPLEEARNLCEELRMAVEQPAWSRMDLDNDVTMSFGVAESRPEVTASALVDVADRRLYAAENSGRNRVAG